MKGPSYHIFLCPGRFGECLSTHGQILENFLLVLTLGKIPSGGEFIQEAIRLSPNCWIDLNVLNWSRERRKATRTSSQVLWRFLPPHRRQFTELVTRTQVIAGPFAIHWRHALGRGGGAIDSTSSRVMFGLGAGLSRRRRRFSSTADSNAIDSRSSWWPKGAARRAAKNGSSSG